MLHGFLPPHRYFAYLTWQQIAAMPDKENVVIAQPMGAIEQHGPHLPLAVDAAIAAAVLGQALTQLPDAIPAYGMPPLYYGKSNEHWHFPGTITLSAQTLRQVLMESAESLYRAGFRKLLWLNAHGGQPQVLDMAARDLHQQYPDLMVFPQFVWNVPNPAAEMLTEKRAGTGHSRGRCRNQFDDGPPARSGAQRSRCLRISPRTPHRRSAQHGRGAALCLGNAGPDPEWRPGRCHRSEPGKGRSPLCRSRPGLGRRHHRRLSISTTRRLEKSLIPAKHEYGCKMLPISGRPIVR